MGGFIFTMLALSPHFWHFSLFYKIFDNFQKFGHFSTQLT